MNKIFFYFIALVMMLFVGCSNPENPAVKPECTSVNEATTCDSDEFCDDGFCKRIKCSDAYPDGPCPTGRTCQDVNGAYRCVANECSIQYPNGVCDDGKFCDNGVCSDDYICSNDHPNGKCSNGKTCISGVCQGLTCNADNPNGTCENGKKCVDGSCVDDLCGVDNPTGSCTDANKYCKEGICTSFECSGDHPNGVCPNGQACNAGSCEAVACGKDYPNGTCPDGEFCTRVIEGGNYTYTCQAPKDCTSKEDCDPGFTCDQNGKCIKDDTCIPACGDKMVCEFGECVDDPYYCSPNSPQGWCPDGELCSINGVCEENIQNPCDNASCDPGKSCIVTSFDDQTYECVSFEDQCSNSNPDGVCPDGKSCVGGNCITVIDPCAGVECSAGKICDPNTSACVDDACDPAPACPKEEGRPADENMMCLNTFDSRLYICNCKPGYDFDNSTKKCILQGNLCDGKDCGLGYCNEGQGVQGGWECICNDNMQHSVTTNPKSKCVDPGVYDFCLDMDCGHGTCRVETRDEDRYGVCDCDTNYLFNGETCEPGIDCAETICDPTREACQFDMCVEQFCGVDYPNGICENPAETCVDNECKLTTECHGSLDGFCMNDDYSCKDGTCCKDGICDNMDDTQKLIGETCDLATNNCENQAFCIPTPTGDGVCQKTCDTSNSDTCNSAEGYHCLANGIFVDNDFEYIGVCVKDDNCTINDNGGCNDQQVCLNFRNSSATQCYGKNANNHLGASCSVGTSAMGFNIGCDNYSLCINGTCVPNCLKSSDPENLNLDITMCYNSYDGTFDLQNLKVKDFETLTFEAGANRDNSTLCTPNVTNCGNGESCIQLQEKDTTEATSKAIGLCVTSCNFDAAPYRDQCSDNKVCYKTSTDATLCLDGKDCSTYDNDGCMNGVCYPITQSVNTCMNYTDTMGHPGDDCNETDMICQQGECISGTCQFVCDLTDNNFSCDNNGETCQSTSDGYLNNSSHFSSTRYGTCQ